MNVDTDDIPFVPFKASKPARVTTAKKAAEAEREARAEALDFAVVSRRVFEEAGEGRYFFRIVDAGVVFELDRVRRERQELWGELGVTCDLPGAKGIGPEMSLVIADFNLSSLQARQTRAKLLAERSRAGVIDWYGLMEDFCQRVIKAERSGNPAVQLRDLPRPEAGRVLNVDGWKLPSEHPTILFGDGGTLKSMLALYAAGTLANQGLRVMYVDWELEGSEHRDRLERLFGAEMPEIWYVRADRPLVSEVDRLRRSRVDHGIDYVVYDSIAFACDGPPESAEVASAYFRAVRKVGAGSLHIAHISRSETADQKPFGSSFWHNGARSTWFAQQAEQMPGQPVVVALLNRKSNLGALSPATAFGFRFTPDRTEVVLADVTTVSEVSAKLPLWQRMKGALTASGPMTYPDLATEVNAKLNTIIQTVNRSEGRLFVRMTGSDGVVRVGLAAR